MLLPRLFGLTFRSRTNLELEGVRVLLRQRREEVAAQKVEHHAAQAQRQDAPVNICAGARHALLACLSPTPRGCAVARSRGHVSCSPHARRRKREANHAGQLPARRALLLPVRQDKLGNGRRACARERLSAKRAPRVQSFVTHATRGMQALQLPTGMAGTRDLKRSARSVQCAEGGLGP
jgi:hypothetical protein